MNRWTQLANVLAHQNSAVLVSVAATKGSVPRDTDAWMIVTPQGFHGSIGGGTLEWKAMAEAQAMLANGRVRQSLDIVLGPDLGQCCGGRVELAFETFSPQDLPSITANISASVEEQRQIYLFGAGHVGRALVLALAPLPFKVIWIDPRPNAFPTFVPANVTLLQPPDAVTVLGNVPEASLVYVMTHSHTLDLAIVDAALRLNTVAHVGLIGSATKRARFEKRLSEAGVDQKQILSLTCPIGVSGIKSKHPAAIAAAVAAEMLQLDASLTAEAQTEVRGRNTGG
jgi:xanthine dehydrogenase accessory factor